jgi:5-methylcytosine-specific restriction endonuclease McrA
MQHVKLTLDYIMNLKHGHSSHEPDNLVGATQKSHIKKLDKNETSFFLNLIGKNYKGRNSRK